MEQLKLLDEIANNKHYKIDFRQERTFGELFNATSMFVRMEFATLLKTLSPVIMIFIFFRVSTDYAIRVFADETTTSSESENIFESYVNYMASPDYWVHEFWEWLFLGIIAGLVYSHIKLYINNEGRPGTKEIYREMRNSIRKVLLLTFLMTVIMYLLSPFLLVPSVIFFVYSILAVVVVAIEQGGVTRGMKPIRESFVLMKGSWWKTLGGVIVLFFIIYILKLIPYVVDSIFWFGFGMGDIIEPDTVVHEIFVLFFAATKEIPYIVYSYPMIFTAFLYFSQLEKKRKFSLLNEIETIK
jgi:hypothetical protein